MATSAQTELQLTIPPPDAAMVQSAMDQLTNDQRVLDYDTK